jgi:hypothetical protein
MEDEQDEPYQRKYQEKHRKNGEEHKPAGCGIKEYRLGRHVAFVFFSAFQVNYLCGAVFAYRL